MEIYYLNKCRKFFIVYRVFRIRLNPVGYFQDTRTLDIILDDMYYPKLY